jgi:hypothetical protein
MARRNLHAAHHDIRAERFDCEAAHLRSALSLLDDYKLLHA